jgi:hypothetical protein
LSRDSFQPPTVQRLLLVLARLRVAAGCGLSGGWGKNILLKFTIIQTSSPDSPCVGKQHRSHSHSFRFASLRAFTASTLAPLAAARRWSLNLFRLQPISFIAAFTSFWAVGTLNLPLAFSEPTHLLIKERKINLSSLAKVS